MEEVLKQHGKASSLVLFMPVVVTVTYLRPGDRALFSVPSCYATGLSLHRAH